ncbi:MAG: hypothetical protein AAFW89_03515 [Bacteroidota bacterium]
MRTKHHIIGLFWIIVLVLGSGCDGIFNSKSDSTTDEIFDQGRINPELPDQDGYAPVQPIWTNFDAPNDIHVGFDELVYVTDREGLHLLDRGDLSPRVTIPFNGANAVVQDRLLNVYVSARIDTVLPDIDPNYVWNLPAVFKLKNVNGAGPLQFVDTLIFPFDDGSLSNITAQSARLDSDSNINYERVEVTGLAILADNTLYVSRRGPFNETAQVASPDNTILEFQRIVEGGVTTDKMRNVRQIRTLNPTTPSLRSSINVSSIASFIAPPQRDIFPDNRSFLITQDSPNQSIPFRVLWINAVETTDGLIFEQNSDLLVQDTAQADGFLYETDKFLAPQDIAFSGDDDSFIFVIDSGLNRLYQFQLNGQEGVPPPPGAANQSRQIMVSFGGPEPGNGPLEFNNPQGVAYFRQVVYVADTGNNRILRFKLNTDFE